MQCRFTKANNDRCRAQALKGYELCFTHEPGHFAERRLAHRNGGLARRHRQAYINTPIELQRPQDVQELIQVTLNSILRGKMPASNPGNTVGFLSHCWLEAYQAGEINDRLSLAEMQLEKLNEQQNRI